MSASILTTIYDLPKRKTAHRLCVLCLSGRAENTPKACMRYIYWICTAVARSINRGFGHPRRYCNSPANDQFSHRTGDKKGCPLQSGRLY